MLYLVNKSNGIYRNSTIYSVVMLSFLVNPSFFLLFYPLQRRSLSNLLRFLALSFGASTGDVSVNTGQFHSSKRYHRPNANAIMGESKLMCRTNSTNAKSVAFIFRLTLSLGFKSNGAAIAVDCGAADCEFAPGAILFVLGTIDCENSEVFPE